MSSGQIDFKEGRDPAEVLTEFIDRFEPLVRDHIRRRLKFYNPKYGAIHSADELTQSVWGSVWRVVRNIENVTPERLRGLAYRIARNKMVKRDKKLRAAKSPVYYEVPLAPDQDRAGSDPAPDQVVELHEQWAVQLRALDPRERQIADLLRENRSTDEIAKELNLTVRGAQKACERVRKKLGKHFPE